MQTAAREEQLQELIEEAQDAMNRLIREFSVYALEQKTARYLDRSGFGTRRARVMLREVEQERKRLVSG